MKFIKYLLLVCLLISNAGYAAQKSGKNAGGKTRAISGQVFVVTNGGENIKLALVGISAIPESEFLQFVATSQSIKREAQDKHALAESELEAACAAEKSAKDHSNNLSNSYSEKVYNNQEYKYDFQRWREIDKLENSEEYLEAKRREKAAGDECSSKWSARGSAYAKFRPFKTGEYYFSALPAGFTGKTDADGKFTLDLPAGKYVLAAKSSRRTYRDTEEYYWLVSVNTTSKNQSVMLSNDNIFETKCSDCVHIE